MIGTSGHDGKIVLSATANPKMTLCTLFDSESTKPAINTIAFSNNTGMIASGGGDNIVKIWDIKNKILAYKYKTHFGEVTSIDWHNNDSILASASITGDIVLHNINNTNGLPIANFNQKASNGIKIIRFSPFLNDLLATGCNEGTICIWDINKRNYAGIFPQAHNTKANSLAFSPNNGVLLCSAGMDQNINFYDINSKKSFLHIYVSYINNFMY